MPPVNPNSVPLQLYGNWPGIDDPGKVRVNTAQVRAIANRLEAHLEDLLAADKGLHPPTPGAFGAWDAAKAFYPSARAGHDSLADQHSRILHALMDVIEKLHRVANVYDATEAELERRIAAVDKRLHVVPTADLSGHDTSPATPQRPGRSVANSLNPDGRN